ERAVEFIDDAEHDGKAAAFRAVLLDLNLPKKTGAEVLEHLRHSPKHGGVPVIIVTSSGSRDDRERTERLGATRYFEKPTALDDFFKLGQILRQVLDEQQLLD